MHLFNLCSMPVAPAGVSHTAACHAAAVAAAGCAVTHPAPRIAPGAPRAHVRRVLDPFRARLRGPRLETAYERAVRREILRRRADGEDLAVWSWTGQSPAFLRELADEGVPVVAEKYNCMTRTARRILDEAGARLGVPDAAAAITDAVIELEEARTRAAAFVSTPAPEVTRSVVDAGIDPSRILETGYGWDPERFRTRAHPPTPGAHARRIVEPTFVFLGRGGIRKGLPMLLDAWAIARRRGLRARLLVVGAVDEAVGRLRGDALAAADVQVAGYRTDIGPLLAGATAFVFPTLEEGSPIVVLEALAHGLPVVTSPMGAGRVVRDGVEGFVHDPWDVEACAASLLELARDRDRRDALALAARARAATRTWSAIGVHRAAAFRGALGLPARSTDPALSFPTTTDAAAPGTRKAA